MATTPNDLYSFNQKLKISIVYLCLFKSYLYYFVIVIYILEIIVFAEMTFLIYCPSSYLTFGVPSACKKTSDIHFYIQIISKIEDSTFTIYNCKNSMIKRTISTGLK